MNTTARELAQLARGYAARAQPQSSASNETDETEVDVRITHALHEAVRAVAAYNGQNVNDVARAILFDAASKVTHAQIAKHQALIKERIARAVETTTKRMRKRGASDPEIQAKVDLAVRRIQRQRLPLRSYGVDRYRLRFTVPTAPYLAARDRIQASGRSVAVAVEDGLTAYAKSRKIN
ncbi:MAG TPA: hypothetical protein VGH72_33995 [Pseudonocardia sp.]|jgi:hypothetical protein